MLAYPDQIYCKGCGIEITWGAHVVDHENYCCEDCATGIPCFCGERMESDDERKTYSPPPSIPYS